MQTYIALVLAAPIPSAAAATASAVPQQAAVSWLQPLTTLAATLLGGAIGYFSALGMKRRDEQRSANAVRVQLLCMLESARELMSAFDNMVSDRNSAPSEFSAEDRAITALYGRAFAADVAVALTPYEARLLHRAVMQLHRTACGVETMLDTLESRGAPSTIMDHIKLPKRVVSNANATIEALDVAHAAISEKLPAASRDHRETAQDRR